MNSLEAKYRRNLVLMFCSFLCVMSCKQFSFFPSAKKSSPEKQAVIEESTLTYEEIIDQKVLAQEKLFLEWNAPDLLKQVDHQLGESKFSSDKGRPLQHSKSQSVLDQVFEKFSSKTSLTTPTTKNILVVDSKDLRDTALELEFEIMKNLGRRYQIDIQSLQGDKQQLSEGIDDPLVLRVLQKRVRIDDKVFVIEESGNEKTYVLVLNLKVRDYYFRKDDILPLLKAGKGLDADGSFVDLSWRAESRKYLNDALTLSVWN